MTSGKAVEIHWLSQKGITYAAPYATGWSDKSVVDKGYVDNMYNPKRKVNELKELFEKL